MWITGPAGIGKTVLLDNVLTSAVEWTVVRVEGAVSESKMMWSGVSQLVHRLRHQAVELKPSQQRVIEAIIDPTSGDLPDAFAAAVSVHALLVQAAETGPVVVAVEDHQWLDPDSVRVLDFVGRRLDGVRAALVITSRNQGSGDAIALGPLPLAESVEVLTDLGVARVTAHRLVDIVGGHPFALTQAARSLSPRQRSGAEPLPSPFPMSADDLPAVLAAAIGALPDHTRQALHLLSAAGALGRGWRDVMARAEVPIIALSAAEDAGVIAIAADSMRFTHPLFRAAVYADATPTQRRASHRLLAEVEVDPERSLWHESRAIIGPDDDVAARLAVVAERAYATGAYASAFEAWHRAGELSSRSDRAERYEIRAAESALLSGNNTPAQEIFERSPALQSSDAHLVRLAATYEARSGHPDDAYALFLRAGELLVSEDPDRAAQAFVDAARTPLRVGQLHAAAAAMDRLEGVIARVGTESVHRMATVIRSLLDSAAGGPTAAFVAATNELVPPTGVIAGDLSFLADTVALGLAHQRQHQLALDLIERLRAAAADRNQPSIIPFLDTAKACALSSVDLPGCMIAAANAVEWADAIGQPNLATGALGYLGNVQAALGDPGVFATSERVAAIDTDHGRVSSHLMRGYYWLSLGQPERAIDELLPLHEWSAGELKTVLFWQCDLGEAAARAGRPDLAREVADQLHSFDRVFPNSWLRGAAARIEGLLADIDHCGPWFESSVSAFKQADNSMAEARSQLIWGERLRRGRRRSEARQHLARALHLFEQLGAGRWVERCEQELIAAGGATSPADHTHDAERVLTPQELQIARLSVAGHSNRDIGALMFISPRTVETHLSAIYRKLGVRNRGALAAAATTDPALRIPAA